MTTARSGQAALEYLFTYGWAFMAVLVTLGALAYFGIFDLDSLRGQECVFPPGTTCHDFQLTEDLSGDAFLDVVLLNYYGVDLNITDANASTIDFAFVDCDWDNPDDVWYQDGFLNISCEMPSGEYREGDTYDAEVDVFFTQAYHTYEHNISGSVRVRST